MKHQNEPLVRVMFWQLWRSLAWNVVMNSKIDNMRLRFWPKAVVLNHWPMLMDGCDRVQCVMLTWWPWYGFIIGFVVAGRPSTRATRFIDVREWPAMATSIVLVLHCDVLHRWLGKCFGLYSTETNTYQSFEIVNWTAASEVLGSEIQACKRTEHIRWMSCWTVTIERIERMFRNTLTRWRGVLNQLYVEYVRNPTNHNPVSSYDTFHISSKT